MCMCTVQVVHRVPESFNVNVLNREKEASDEGGERCGVTNIIWHSTVHMARPSRPSLAPLFIVGRKLKKKKNDKEMERRNRIFLSVGQQCNEGWGRGGRIQICREGGLRFDRVCRSAEIEHSRVYLCVWLTRWEMFWRINPLCKTVTNWKNENKTSEKVSKL